VNEKALIDRGYINANSVKNLQGLGQENFNTKAYLMGEYQATPDKKARTKANPLKNPNGTPRTTVNL
jgi:sulfatase modifying factor 1